MNTRPLSLSPIGWLRKPTRADLWPHIALMLVVVAVVIPLAFLILGSFSTAKLPTEFSLADLSLRNYLAVWLDPATYDLFYNTFVYVIGATIIGVGLAATLAWLVERTNMPGKIWIYAGVPMTLAVPGLLQAVAWALLFSPRSGFINRYAIDTFGLDGPFFDVYSLSGMVLVEGLRLVPTAFLMLVPLLRAMDPALEEAAAVSGARPSSILRRVTIVLMAPGLVAVTIFQAITALEIFEVPGILGMPANIHVFATKIFAVMQLADSLPRYGEANALAMIYVLIGVSAAYLYWRVVRRSERYTVITGKGYRPHLIDLGPWRGLMVAIVMIYLFLSVVLPFVVLLYVSLVPFLQPPSIEAVRSFTLDNYRQILNYGLFQQTLTNTILMVGATATLTTVVSFLISFVIVRTKFWGRGLLDQLTFLPHAIPGIVMGLAFLWVFLNLGIFGSLWTIILAFTVGFMAYGTRSMSAAILQIHTDLEEAAQVSGAPPWRTMLRVFLPLMLPTFVGLWIWVVLLSVRIAGLPLILHEGPRNEVLAVLIWVMWDDGAIESVGAVGVLLMIVLLALALGLRVVGFGRNISQSG